MAQGGGSLSLGAVVALVVHPSSEPWAGAAQQQQQQQRASMVPCRVSTTAQHAELPTALRAPSQPQYLLPTTWDSCRAP